MTLDQQRIDRLARLLDLIDAAIERLDLDGMDTPDDRTWDRACVLETRYERVELAHYIALGRPAEDLTGVAS